MKKILVYFPYNHRTVEQQSVMELLVKKGHEVFLLTLLPQSDLHAYVKGLGVHAFASPVKNTSRVFNLLFNARYLISFCREYKIDIIVAHQQLCALPLIFARPFINARSYYIRHNSDEDYIKFPRKAWLMNRFINGMLPNIIAPSDIVYRYMIEKEKVAKHKMQRINYGYNFSQYEVANLQEAVALRQNYSCRLLVISIARLVPVKRHHQMFQAIQHLIANNMDVKMICLGDGPIKQELQSWVNSNGMDKNIFLLGMRRNIFDYFSASDVLLHLSETEASNSVVKECGLAGKPPIVCERVGDFNDYIINGENGFLVNKEFPLAETIKVLENLYYDEKLLLKTGQKLHAAILSEFDIKNVSLQYDALINPG